MRLVVTLLVAVAVSGMDTIGMAPIDVIYSLALILPVAALLAAIRTSLHRRRTLAAEGP